MSAITLLLSSALLHFIWQGVLVAGLLWLALFMLRKRSANARYIASCVALSVLAILPLITMAAIFESPVSLSINTPVPTVIPPPVSSPSAVPGAIRAPWLVQAQPWILTAWSVGVLLFSLRILWGCNYIYILKRRGAAADRAVLEVVRRLARMMGIHRPVRVLMSTIAEGPSVVGWLRPVVLLPASSLLGLSPEQLEAVIAHELAHIRRHDYIVSAFQVVVETLLFYHPAVWWTSSRIRHERELCCDDLAVRACGDALCYARALTKLERLRVVKPSLVLGGTDGSLLYRIQRIVGEKTMEYGPSKLSGVLVLLLALAGLGLNLSWASAQVQPQESAAKHVAEMKMMASESRDQGGVSVNLGAASVLHRSAVEYPESAIKKGIQGEISVEATLDSTGNVVDARILSGPPELRRSVLQSILEWHFTPDGAQASKIVRVVFDLAVAKEAMKERPVYSVTLANGQVATAIMATKEQRAAEEKMFVDRAKGEMAEYTRAERTNLKAQDEAKAKLMAQQDGEYRKMLESELSANREVQLKLEKAAQADAKAKGEQDMDYRKKMEMEAGATREVRLKLERAALEGSLAGRVLTRISSEGLSDQTREDIVRRLAVRIGDTLSKDSLEKLSETLRQYDEHMRLRLITVENNGAELRILAP